MSTGGGDFYDDNWGRFVNSLRNARHAVGSAIASPFRGVRPALQPLVDRWVSLDPRVRVLWALIPTVLVLLFPQETTSNPQAFSLIGVGLFLLLGAISPVTTLVLLIVAVLIVINMREVPSELFSSGPGEYPLDTGPEILLIILPVAIAVAYALHVWKGADFRMLCAILVLASLPLTLALGPSAEPRTFVLFLVAFNILLGLGLNVVVGYAGLLDLGFVAFFAIGGYAWALMSTEATGGDFAAPLGIIDANFWIITIVAVFLAASVGVLLGIPVLRLRGDYLAIVTLGFGEIIRIIATNADGEGVPGNLTNGVFGIRQIGNPNPFPEIDLGLFSIGGELISHSEAFWLTMVCALAVGFVSEQLRNSKVGRAWEAIREDEEVAQGMGINTVHYKLLAFGMGAAIGGLGGAIRTSHFSAVTPADFQLIVSINVLAIVIIGGMGSVRGVVLGAFILAGIPEILRDVTLKSIVDGGMNIFFLHFIPGLPELGEALQAGPVWIVENLPDANLLGIADKWGLAQKQGQELRLMLFGLLLVIMMIVRPQGLSPSPRRQAEVEMIEEEKAEEAGEAAGFHEGALGEPVGGDLQQPEPSPGSARYRSETE
jgi:branched-chain amino acid transport system permease protein